MRRVSKVSVAEAERACGEIRAPGKQRSWNVRVELQSCRARVGWVWTQRSLSHTGALHRWARCTAHTHCRTGAVSRLRPGAATHSTRKTRQSSRLSTTSLRQHRGHRRQALRCAAGPCAWGPTHSLDSGVPEPRCPRGRESSRAQPHTAPDFQATAAKKNLRQRTQPRGYARRRECLFHKDTTRQRPLRCTLGSLVRTH